MLGVVVTGIATGLVAPVETVIVIMTERTVGDGAGRAAGVVAANVRKVLVTVVGMKKKEGDVVLPLPKGSVV